MSSLGPDSGAGAQGAGRPLPADASGPLRIGELSRRVGVPAETLRAWERRYGLLSPRRTPSGYRLYGPADEARVRSMTALMRAGTAPAEAARLVVEGGASRSGVLVDSAPGPGAGPPVSELLAALERFDDPAVESILDRAIAELSLDGVVGGLVVPALHELGERWEAGRISIAQEHFASNLLRGRLVGLGRGWGAGTGPLALLACPPGELHDLGLIAFGVLIRHRGWRVALLGADTPLDSLAETADALRPELVVVSAVDATRLRVAAEGLRGIGERHALLLAGAGATEPLARGVGARLLPGDAVAAAELVSSGGRIE